MSETKPKSFRVVIGIKVRETDNGTHGLPVTMPIGYVNQFIAEDDGKLPLWAIQAGYMDYEEARRISRIVNGTYTEPTKPLLQPGERVVSSEMNGTILKYVGDAKEDPEAFRQEYECEYYSRTLDEEVEKKRRQHEKATRFGEAYGSNPPSGWKFAPELSPKRMDIAAQNAQRVIDSITTQMREVIKGGLIAPTVHESSTKVPLKPYLGTPSIVRFDELPSEDPKCDCGVHSIDVKRMSGHSTWCALVKLGVCK